MSRFIEPPVRANGRAANSANIQGNSATILRTVENAKNPSTHSDSVHFANSANNANAPLEWAKPIPFREAVVPEFPLHCLPAWAGQFGFELAEATQTPPDMVGGMLLAALSIGLAKKYEVEPTPGWREMLVLWVVVALPPAHRKSAVVRAISDPFFRWEAKQAAELRPVIDRARTKLEVLQKQRARLVQDAAAKSPEESAQALRELDRIDGEIANSLPPSEPRMLADNSTPEALTTLMQRNAGKIGVLAAESDLFDVMFGMYSRNGSPSLGIYLKGHAGDRHRVDRGSRPTEFIEKPALPMGFCIQPEVITSMAQQKSFRGRGGLGRMLFTIPASRLGDRKIETDPVSDSTSATYEWAITELLNITVATDEDGEMVPIILKFSDHALSLFNDYRIEIEGQLGEFGRLGLISDWGGKLTGAVARIAGLLHVAANVGQSIPRAIGLETVEHAITLGRYYTEHALAAYRLMGADVRVASAEHVLKWIKRKGWGQFSKRDLFEVVKGNSDYSKADDLDEPLRLLESHNYLALIDQPKTGAGRKPSPMYSVNPQVAEFAQFAESQKTQ